MRIGGQTLAFRLAPVMCQMLLAEPAFEERARIDPGRRVRLKEDEVSGPLCVCRGFIAVKEVIESHLEQLGTHA